MKMEFKTSRLTRPQLFRALQCRRLSTDGNITEQRRRLADDVKSTPQVEPDEVMRRLFDTPDESMTDVLISDCVVPASDLDALRAQYGHHLAGNNNVEEEGEDNEDPERWSSANLEFYIQEN